ncbi:hypothetical protein ACFY1L_18935 [Streptomyces sp. NPDC001663]|uniref:hypothetical protein n=1 Tax=Streptomyces sp. NPDC001663 TaxID=3364597 RepID=UPI0036CFFB99
MMRGPLDHGVQGPTVSGGVMAVSLGMRISGLLVVGAVAVAVAAFGGDGSGRPDRGGREGTVVPVGPSDSPRTHTSSASPTPRTSPAGEASGTVGPSGPHHTHTTTPPPSSASPTPSAGNKPLLSPGWLPRGPASPNADAVPDPASVYDRLRDPARCRAALKVIPPVSADPEWRVLRALAAACLAVQGKGGSWETAAREYTALAGKADTCKGRAAYAVLGGLLDFHRQHPDATVQLQASSGGTPACVYRIAGVDRNEAQPGDTVGIELRGTYFDHAELLRYGSVLIGGKQLPGPPVPRSESGDEVVLSAVVPALDGYPKTVDVVVRYGAVEVRLEDAFTVVAPNVLPSPSVPSGTPQGMLPFGPLPAHLPRA